ncbi:hypothetical protein ASG01_12250 [Chryseobacterium sp. Leaf180]|uniref:hypothetical protein n=1 Tax=Chryseobacterium sp. Leaf180 TaxID=1736289 RepID=UPI0006F8FE64|nr:hypothetical protein [Chryseobacterium sp. Leaf180]KQR92661.1 hypothetical protein ASG01_12250 [Chryseobacterium sp. Leaf180]
MKNSFLLAVFCLITLQCTHSTQESPAENIQKTQTAKPKIAAEVFQDDFGDKLEVYRDENEKKLSVKFGGKVYDLKKEFESASFSTSDNVYQFTETKREITFMKKNIGMVLFHGKKNAAYNKIAAQ